MSRTVAVRAVLLAGALGWAAACSDSSGPESPGDPVPGLIVSSPVAGSAGTHSAGTPGSTALVGLVYVSLVPGSVPTGLQARITDQATGLAVTTAVVNGGFDPVAILASLGDTLFVEITREGDAPLHGFAVVAATRPPVVVRASPPPGGRDVPVNATVVIVFSEPLDAATVDTGSVQLWRGSTLVPGTVRFADVEHLRAEFHPDSLLAGQADYALVLSQGIRDVSGEALDAAVTVPFTTGTTAPATGLVFASVSAGWYHACGITTSGQAYCWGNNFYGQLGNGTTTNSTTPVLVLGDVVFQAISAGDMSTCGLGTSGSAYCWGNVDSGYPGLLGDSTTTPSAVPVRVAGGLAFASITVGGGPGHACGVTIPGTAYCWGADGWGQLGWSLSTTGIDNYSLSPVPVLGGHTFASLSAGRDHTCGVTTDGQAYCWGRNDWGRLGIGDIMENPNPQRSPAAVVGGLSFASLRTPLTMSCGLTTGGAIYCWGEAQFPTTADPLVDENGGWAEVYYFPTPTPVTANVSLTTLSTGAGTGCGLTASGDAYCWGDGDARVSGLAPLAGGLTFTSISVGTAVNCGVTTGSVAYCWGNNAWGQLGDGTTTSSSVPVKVAGQPQGSGQ